MACQELILSSQRNENYYLDGAACPRPRHLLSVGPDSETAPEGLRQGMKQLDMKQIGMKQIILGTAGHIDHGKTALVRALTGIDCDRLKEEKRRGITIELGFASLTLPN